MSHQLSSEQFAHLRNNARLLVEQTSALQDDVNTLLSSTERELKEAQTIAHRLEDAELNQILQLLRGHAERSAADVERARRLSQNARAQHGAACHLLAACDVAEAAGPDRATAVLVVDDYPEMRELVARILRDAGFNVRTAANGLEGLIAAHDMRPVVIVMDVSMPVLDGIEATRLIKASHATREAKVIAFTSNPSIANASPHDLFSAVLEKPATPAAVVATVQHVASL